MQALKKFHIFIATCFISALLAYAFLGVYRDREFGGAYLFLKHKPYAKFFFYAPQGEADRSYVPGKEGYLSPEMEQNEMLYIEFIETNKGYKRSVKFL